MISQIDLTQQLDIAAAVLQAGFYNDLQGELLYERRSWTTEYLVSHSDQSDSGFSYVRETNGDLMVSFYSKMKRRLTCSVQLIHYSVLTDLKLLLSSIGMSYEERFPRNFQIF